MSAIFVVRQDPDQARELETTRSEFLQLQLQQKQQQQDQKFATGQLWKVYELPHTLIDDLSLASLRQNLESMEHFDFRDNEMTMDFLHDGLSVKSYMPMMDQYEEVHDVVIEALKDRNLEIAKREEAAITLELERMMQDEDTKPRRHSHSRPSSSSSTFSLKTKHSSSLITLPPPLQTFPLFPLLPKELRLMIWRLAFPDPRIITCRHQLGIPLGGPKYIYLYPAGPFHSQGRPVSAPHARSSTSSTSDSTLQPNFPNPVVLSVCSESRAEALRYYVPATHLHVPNRTTYFSPSRDVLHLEFGDLYSDAVFAAYGPQLDHFKAILLHMWQWCAPFPGAYYIHTSPTHPTRFIAKLRGLREVLLRPRFAEQGNEGREGGDAGERGPRAEDLLREAEEIREEYWKERVLHGDWTVDVVRVVDQDGEVY